MTKTDQWSKELDKELRVSTWPPNSRTSLGPTGKSPIHGGPMSLTTGPKGSTANTQVPETRTTPDVLFTCLVGSELCLSHCGAAIDWTCPRRSHWCSIWLESGEVEGQVDTLGHLLAVFVVFQGTLSSWAGHHWGLHCHEVVNLVCSWGLWVMCVKGPKTSL